MPCPPLHAPSHQRDARLERVVEWYARTHKAPAASPPVPFYCDPEKVGPFAVDPLELQAGTEQALFALFVCLGMYQALRDVVIARQQRSTPPHEAAKLRTLELLRTRVQDHPCEAMKSGPGFARGCSVWKQSARVDCATWKGLPCPVKDSVRVLRRSADHGKFPISALLLHWPVQGPLPLPAQLYAEEKDPSVRAQRLVAAFTRVHRVGPKLANFFVSALCTPELAPGFTPWFPDLNGHELVVLDTNVLRLLTRLENRRLPASYEARAACLRTWATRIPLDAFVPSWPRYSPRLLQECLYAYGSLSNRREARDPCAEAQSPCSTCEPSLCPFAHGRAAYQDQPPSSRRT